MSETAIVPAAEESTRGTALMQIIERAARDPAFDVAKLEQLLAVKERWDAAEARKAFVAALNKFKEAPPDIIKNKQVKFETSKGVTSYKHATLDQVSNVIGAALSAVGISHRWEVEQLAEGKIRVTCVLTHALGHSERVPLEAKADESGNKNSIQGVGSTVTYLQRYTLLAATGMAVRDQDDDGSGGAALHEMNAVVKADFLDNIAKATDTKALEVLWQTIASKCTEIGDVRAYEELKLAVRDKLKALKAPPKQQGTTI